MYNNCCLTITTAATPDPFVTRSDGFYYLTFTAGDRIEIWRVESIHDLEGTASKHVVWRPPPDTPYSADLWAPELHAFNGRWYVYFAGAHPAHGNASHRMYVLGGPSASACPCTGESWEFLGPLRGMLTTQWAIDGTMVILNHLPYFIYSGWPLENPHSTNDLIQELFIARMISPTEVDTSRGPPVRISKPDRKWEWSGDHGINEGPQSLATLNGSWVGIAYSCAGSWTKDYKMATLRYLGGDPLQPGSWRKSDEPLLQASHKGNGPWGPGHGSFISIDGEICSIFHATDRETDGWENRRSRLQRVQFDHDGPHMGRTVGPIGGLEEFLSAQGSRREEHRSDSFKAKVVPKLKKMFHA